MKDRCSFCGTETHCPALVSWLQPELCGSLIMYSCLALHGVVLQGTCLTRRGSAWVGDVSSSANIHWVRWFCSEQLLVSSPAQREPSVYWQQRLCEVMLCACVTSKPPHWSSGAHTGVFHLKSFLSDLNVMWMKINFSLLLLVLLVFASGVALV